MTAPYTDYAHCPICMESHNEDYTEFCAREESHVMCRPCQNGGVNGIPLLPMPWWLMDARVEPLPSIIATSPAMVAHTDRQIAEANARMLRTIIRNWEDR